MNHTNFDNVEAATNAVIDSKLGIDTTEGYVASLERPITSEYFVRPDGTVEFVR